MLTLPKLIWKLFKVYLGVGLVCSAGHAILAVIHRNDYDSDLFLDAALMSPLGWPVIVYGGIEEGAYF